MTTAYRNTKLARPLRPAEVLATGDNPQPVPSEKQSRRMSKLLKRRAGGLMFAGQRGGRTPEAKHHHAYSLWLAYKEGRIVGPSLAPVLRDWGKQFARFDAGKDLPRGELYRRPKGAA